MLSHCADDGGKKARLTEEITKEAVKTIARGMPGDSGWSCGDDARVLFYFCTRGCGRDPAPGIPCAP
jgi:hypothetical protein